MPSVPIFPTIPIPREDVQSLNTSVLALKEAVEMLTHQGGEQAGRHPCFAFVQPEVPNATSPGDIWLCTSGVYSFSIWDGFNWLKVGDIVTPAGDNQLYLNLHQFMRRRGR